LDCPRTSATKVLDELVHNYYFLKKMHFFESLYAIQEGCLFTKLKLGPINLPA
jgi:hypothetical protein